jgi:hypothetical protein
VMDEALPAAAVEDAVLDPGFAPWGTHRATWTEYRRNDNAGRCWGGSRSTA